VEVKFSIFPSILRGTSGRGSYRRPSGFGMKFVSPAAQDLDPKDKKKGSTMKKHLNLIAAAALSIGGLTFVGCDDGVDDTTTTTPPRSTTTTDDKTTVRDDMDRAGDKIERGAEKTGDTIERGVDRTGEAMKEAGRDIRDGADRAEDKLDSATTPTTRPANQGTTTPDTTTPPASTPE
jgi:hypothetical protein